MSSGRSTTAKVCRESRSFSVKVVEIPVRVRADWENIAVGGLLTFGAFAFVFGIIRTVLRNRRTGRARELEEATEQLVGRDRELTRATGRP